MVAQTLDRRLSVAPMMDCTDRHCRYFLRLLSRRALLYTEMIPVGAIVHGDRDRFLGFDQREQPVALQVGGAAPAALAFAAREAAARGYGEINLNVGCPSDRVQAGRFGACLMAEPDLVAACVAAMRAAAPIEVTVKTRIGVDDRDSYEALVDFVGRVAAAGCRSIIVHARKAWLKGLSPKQNREIPPLRYDVVHRLKRDFPDLEIVINGGITTLDAAAAQLQAVDGVMIGRAAYHDPYMLAEADRVLFGDAYNAPTREAVVEAMLPYAETQRARGVPLSAITRPMLGLYNSVPGARAWRRSLSEEAHRKGAGAEVIERALAAARAAADRPLAA
ncbi:MAG: tRNA dihydrouridine(20/20a) synthase DusA [Candidatus Eiseniibacteriota bacterium]